MSKSTKNIIAVSFLIPVIAVLAVVYFLSQRSDDVPEDITPAAETTRLIERLEQDVAGVIFTGEGIERHGMFPLMLPDGDIVWQWLDEPEFLLNQMEARGKIRLAFDLTSIDIAQENYADVNLADFGLNPPQLTMEVVYTDETRETIRIGSQTPDMRNRFAMIGDDPRVHIVPGLHAGRTFAMLTDLLDTTLPQFSTEAQYLLIAREGEPPIELILGIDDSAMAIAGGMQGIPVLRMHQPIEGRGLNHMALENVVIEPLNAIFISDIISAVPTDLAAYGLDEPSMEIRYADGFGAVHLLFGDTFMHEFFGQEIPHIYVKFANRPHVFAVPYAAVAEIFDINIFRFIDRFFALISISTVESVDITSANPQRNFTMVINEEADSTRIHPTINGADVAESDFRQIYQLLIGLQADGDIEPFEPQGEPEFIITYNMLDEPNRTLRFFAWDSTFYAVSVDGEDAWLVTNRLAVQTLFNVVTTTIAE